MSKYKLLKTKGHNGNISVENTETKANIIIGRLSPTIASILEKTGGYEIGTAPCTYVDEWNIDITDELAQELAHTTMTMSKPFRDQSKKAKTTKATSGASEQVDAFDLIFGSSNI